MSIVDRLYARAEAGKNPPRWAAGLVLGYADDGDMYLPCQGRKSREHGHAEVWWDVPMHPRRPAHWPYMLTSLITGWFVWVEGGS